MIRLFVNSSLAMSKWGNVTETPVTGSTARQSRRIARLVLPRLEMHRLSRSDAYQDAQHFNTACPLRQRWIEAVSTLFNRWKVKGRSVGNRLKEVRIFQIIIGPGNGCVLVHRQSWNRLRKDVVWIKIRVMRTVAIAGPPAGIQC